MPGRSRRRALLVLALLALLVHAGFLGGVGGSVPDRPPTVDAASAMNVRAVEAAAVADAQPMVVEAQQPEATPSVRPAALPRAPRRSTPGPRAITTLEPPPTPPPAPPAVEIAMEASPMAASAPAPALDPSPGAASSPMAPLTAAPAASATFLAAGEMPPPTYRTVLPPSAILRYDARRGPLRGAGEIRWQRNGDEYALRLEARIAGLALLTQTSQGRIDADGLAPTRFVDQRGRRSAQAANFQRETGVVRFSGPATVWPLLAGSQDQLSWMIQLAGIVAAEPERAIEGGRIAMVIVGARGEASVRTLRFVGRENAETAAGSVPALKFIVDGRATYDTSYEIWLDPAHDFLPLRATQRNAAGESQLDLSLDRIEPPP